MSEPVEGVSQELIEEMLLLNAWQPVEVDYVYHLVPFLKQITDCPFYWGKMDRFTKAMIID